MTLQHHGGLPMAKCWMSQFWLLQWLDFSDHHNRVTILIVDNHSVGILVNSLVLRISSQMLTPNSREWSQKNQQNVARVWIVVLESCQFQNDLITSSGDIITPSQKDLIICKWSWPVTIFKEFCRQNFGWQPLAGNDQIISSKDCQN